MQNALVSIDHFYKNISALWGLKFDSNILQAEDLGLQDDVIAVSRSHPSAQNRFIYAGGELCPLPSGLLIILYLTLTFWLCVFLLFNIAC